VACSLARILNVFYACLSTLSSEFATLLYDDCFGLLLGSVQSSFRGFYALVSVWWAVLSFVLKLVNKCVYGASCNICFAPVGITVLQPYTEFIKFI
jgi:predicted Co/Zn/Cd cation transporter (cation efflux family)